jgi:hypothetical protein
MKTVLCSLLVVAAAWAETVPVPKSTALGFTADSFPFNSASRDLQPLTLA